MRNVIFREQSRTVVIKPLAIIYDLEAMFMMYGFLAEDNSLVDEIIDSYSSLRLHGHSREASLARICQSFEAELSDEDDRPFVLIAIALALCKKRELTPQTRNDALQAIELLRKRPSDHSVPYNTRDFDRLIGYLSADRIGPEVPYRARKAYDPGWSIGDTFIHPFSQSAAEQMGLLGWYIVFRKVGEYLDRKSRHMQLVYITVCPPDAIPQTDTELSSLGYLRMMEHDNGWDYLGQLCFKSKKDEDQWDLHKIGCFPNAGIPNDAITEDPIVSMPFYGVLHRNSQVLDYEDQVCHLIKFRGIKRSKN